MAIGRSGLEVALDLGGTRDNMSGLTPGIQSTTTLDMLRVFWFKNKLPFLSIACSYLDPQPVRWRRVSAEMNHQVSYVLDSSFSRKPEGEHY
jgi:hypothetical protein